MKYFIIILAGAIVSCACHRKMPTASENPSIPSAGNNIPTCLQQKIDSIKKLPVWNPPASIEQYDYNGKTVYLMSADCCDFFATALDENCNYVCAPSGGFTGKGDGLCKDFNEKAKLVKLVWKDERVKK